MAIVDAHYWHVQTPMATFYALWESPPLAHKLLFLKAQVLQLTPDQRHALWVQVDVEHDDETPL
jgi:hypothetical protein